MQDNVEKTKEIGLEDLVPNEPQKISEEKEMKTKHMAKKKPTKKNKGKIKPIYIAIGLFVAIVVLMMGYVWIVSSHDGPVYGHRCEGMTEISDETMTSVVDERKANDSALADLSIEIDCKTIKINMTMAEDVDEESAKQSAIAILSALDSSVGLSKSNSESQYSDLFGTANGKTQYHVDFVIKGSSDVYPIFGTKHPLSDEINFTLNTARDPDLVEKLQEQQTESEEGNEE